MQAIVIRPAELKDAAALNSIRRHKEVFMSLMALPSETIRSTEDFLASRTARDHLMCAEITGNDGPFIVGMAGLHIKPLLRERHGAEIGIMVHPDFFRQGVGTALMDAIVDLADKWLMLKRLELSVYPDNIAAIKLYKNFGFVEEGVMKYAGIRHGNYTDIVLMARYKLA